MSLDAARRFVSKMREDKLFRTAVEAAAEEKKTEELFQNHRMEIDLHDLTLAMAACMEEMSKSMKNKQ